MHSQPFSSNVLFSLAPLVFSFWFCSLSIGYPSNSGDYSSYEADGPSVFAALFY
jgi:hypothetical protein